MKLINLYTLVIVSLFTSHCFAFDNDELIAAYSKIVFYQCPNDLREGALCTKKNEIIYYLCEGQHRSPTGWKDWDARVKTASECLSETQKKELPYLYDCLDSEKINGEVICITPDTVDYEIHETDDYASIVQPSTGWTKATMYKVFDVEKSLNCPEYTRDFNEKDCIIATCENGSFATPQAGCPTCFPPFSLDGDQCIKDCPPEKPFLDINEESAGELSGTADCIAPKQKKEPATQCEANPVLVSNGTKIQPESPDIISTGAYPLYFARNYNSQRSLEAQELRQKVNQKLPPTSRTEWVRYVQPAGYKGRPSDYVEKLIEGTRVAGYKSWSHNYFGLLEEYTFVGSTVRLSTSRGNAQRFTRQADGSYKPDHLTSDTLTRVEDDAGNLSHWVYRSVDNLIEHYNAQGLLTRRTNRTGLSHNLEYSGNVLIKVRDDANNQLDFTYDGKGKIASIASSTGEVVTYGYDQYANLKTVTKTLISGKETTRTYHYEDARHPYALTGITDEMGIRYATWEYDGLGRAITSKHADEADKTTFAFEDNKTTVTNPLGKQTIYNYSTTSGAKRLEKVEGVATQSCLGANQHYEYYSNGQLKSNTDWKGSKTEFEYNLRGLEIKRTEAVGTTEQRLIITTWHPEFNLPSSVTIANKVTTYDYNANGLLVGKRVSGM